MTISELAELTANLLLRYYDNDIQPFLDHCHEDVLWIGPAQGQMVQSKEALVEAFGRETHDLRFAVYNLTTYPMYISTHCSEVLLTFVVDTFWPDGQMNRSISVSALPGSRERGRHSYGFAIFPMRSIMICAITFIRCITWSGIRR